MYKEIFIKGHYRSGGVFVSPHIRKVKVKGYAHLKNTVKSYKSVDPGQLTFDFSGKTQ